MDESILKLITEYAANERLDDIMLGDEEHMAIQKEVDLSLIHISEPPRH